MLLDGTRAAAAAPHCLLQGPHKEFPSIEKWRHDL
eukprot:COSAG05_NODE_15518_length_367_cov_1.302239_1_plen_34_part_10